MINLFNRCPACGGQVIVTECKCTSCQMQMRGEFFPGRFSTLTEDQLTFIQVFLKARGNLTEMERILGISYPTIRNKLEEINHVFENMPELAQASNPVKEMPAKTNSEPDLRQEILRQVSDGRLTVAEGLRKLQGLKGGEK